MSGVTISDFKIRVKLDSNSAIKGLRRLELMLATLKKGAAKSLVVTAKLTQSMEKMAERQAAFAEKRAKADVRAIGFAKKMEERYKNAAKAYSDYSRGLKDTLPNPDKIDRISNGMGKTAASAERTRGAFTGLASILGGIFNFRTFAVATAGMYGLLTAVTKVADVVQFIVENGGRAKSAFATLNASMTNLDVAKGMSPKALNQLKKQQRNFVEHLAKTYGVGMSQTAVDYAKFASASANNIGLGTSQELFKSLTEFGVVYQVGPEKMERVFTAFTQMANKNQVMAEELKTQLGDSLPGALEIFVKALNRTQKYGIVTVENIWKMMEQGKIVANDVFPYISQILKEFSSGGLSEALGTITTKISIMKQVRDEIFTEGTLTQFDDTLSRIIEKVTNLFKSQGFQVAVGSFINDTLLGLEEGTDSFYSKLKAFEKEFDAAAGDDKKQLAIAGTFWDKVAMPGAKSFFAYIGNKIYGWIASALNNFSASDFVQFSTFLGDLFYQALVRAFHLMAIALLGEDSQLAQVLSDLIAGKNDVGPAVVLGSILDGYTDWTKTSKNPLSNPENVFDNMLAALKLPFQSAGEQVFNFFGVQDAADASNKLGREFSIYAPAMMGVYGMSAYSTSSPYSK